MITEEMKGESLSTHA